MMDVHFKEFILSDNKELLQMDRICALLNTTYWAKDRSGETIQKSIEHSLCFGVYHEGEQIAFCRCVTDDATIYWLADVIVDERYRGRGIGKAMMNAVASHERLQGLSGILATRDAQKLYAKYGFALVDPGLYMRKPAQAVNPPEKTDTQK